MGPHVVNERVVRQQPCLFFLPTGAQDSAKELDRAVPLLVSHRAGLVQRLEGARVQRDRSDVLHNVILIAGDGAAAQKPWQLGECAAVGTTPEVLDDVFLEQRKSCDGSVQQCKWTLRFVQNGKTQYSRVGTCVADEKGAWGERLASRLVILCTRPCLWSLCRGKCTCTTLRSPWEEHTSDQCVLRGQRKLGETEVPQLCRRFADATPLLLERCGRALRPLTRGVVSVDPHTGFIYNVRNSPCNRRHGSAKETQGGAEYQHHLLLSLQGHQACRCCCRAAALVIDHRGVKAELFHPCSHRWRAQLRHQAAQVGAVRGCEWSNNRIHHEGDAKSHQTWADVSWQRSHVWQVCAGLACWRHWHNASNVGPNDATRCRHGYAVRFLRRRETSSQ